MRSRNKGTTRSLVDSYLSSDVSLEKGFHEMKTPSVDTSDDDFRTSFARRRAKGANSTRTCEYHLENFANDLNIYRPPTITLMMFNER